MVPRQSGWVPKAGWFTSTDGQGLFCRCPSRPRSSWSTCMKSPWSTSSRRTPYCTSTQSRWPPWCGCGSSWSRSGPICSAAGRRWQRTCAAGKPRVPAHPSLFLLPARTSPLVGYPLSTFPGQPFPRSVCLPPPPSALAHFTFSSDQQKWTSLLSLTQGFEPMNESSEQ